MKSPKHLLIEIFVKVKFGAVCRTVSVCKTSVGSIMKARNEINKTTQLAQWDNVTDNRAITALSSFEDIKRRGWLRTRYSTGGLWAGLWDNIKSLHVSEEMVGGNR